MGERGRGGAPGSVPAPAGAAPWPGRVAALAAFALSLALYWRTAAPTVYGVDSAELTTGAYLLGIVHPPGAPTYLLAGHLFAGLPFGDVGYRLNLFSAVAAAAACGGVALVVARLTGAAALALVTGLVAAASYYIWITGVAAELYALQGLVVVTLIALALQWRRSGAWYLETALWLLAGLGLGVHLSTATLLPGLALLARRPGGRPALAAGALLLGASVYLYLPLRHLAELPLDPARDYWRVDLASWDGFVWMITGGGFRRHLFAAPAAAVPVELGRALRWLWSNYLGLGALLGVIGLIDGLRRTPGVHRGLALMFAGQMAYFLFYDAGDKEVMNQPALLIWAIWIGVGAVAVGHWLARRAALGSGALIAGVVLVSLAGLLLLVNLPLADVSGDRSARERGEAIVAALAPDAVFVGAWPDVRLVEYLQHVERQRPDIRPFDAFFSTTAERATQIAAALQAGRPVYVSTCRDLPDPGLRCEYVPGCDCHRLRPPS